MILILIFNVSYLIFVSIYLNKIKKNNFNCLFFSYLLKFKEKYLIHNSLIHNILMYICVII